MEVRFKLDYHANYTRYRKGSVHKVKESDAQLFVKIGVAEYYTSPSSAKELVMKMETKEEKFIPEKKRGRKPKNEG